MKATFKIELRKDYATKDGKRAICLRYTANRRTTLISLNIYIKPRYWNKVSCSVRESELHCYYYNRAISEFYRKADTIAMEYFFTSLPVPQFLKRLKDKHHGNTDFYVFIENKIKLVKKSDCSFFSFTSVFSKYKVCSKKQEMIVLFVEQHIFTGSIVYYR